MKSMNYGFLFPRNDSADEARHVGIHGCFVHVDMSWQWRTLFSYWDEKETQRMRLIERWTAP